MAEFSRQPLYITEKQNLRNIRKGEKGNDRTAKRHHCVQGGQRNVSEEEIQ